MSEFSRIWKFEEIYLEGDKVKHGGKFYQVKTKLFVKGTVAPDEKVVRLDTIGRSNLVRRYL
jgi:hypothetical protein